MDSEDMVETVARAINTALSNEGVITIAFRAPHATDTATIRRAQEADERRALAMARAAIAAMREPTPEMIEAGKDVLVYEYDPDLHSSEDAARRVVVAMMDAALTRPS